MRFDFYLENQSGSSSFMFTPATMWTRGLGGAEMGLVGLTEELARLGNEIHVWNTPLEGAGEYNGVEYHDVNSFDLFGHYDNFIAFRNPFYELPYIQANFKGWFSTDQRTCGDYSQDILPFVQHSFVISEYHRQYHITNYHFDPARITAIDLGVRVQDYEKSVAKQPNRLIHCSVPSRGAQYLPNIFKKIKQAIPDAELWLLGDFSMWGAGIGAHDETYRQMFDGIDGVYYAGKLPRPQLVELQLSSDLMVYPNAPSDSAYEELFSVSTAECQVAGCVPITSYYGGLQTTVIIPASFVCDWKTKTAWHPSEPRYGEMFVAKTIALLKDRHLLESLQRNMSYVARARFNWNTIAHQWLDVVENVRQT